MSRTSAFLTAVGALSLFALGAPQANATLITPLVSEFAVLGQFSNNQTNYNNGSITGDVGIGSPRQFTISNASLTGNVRFSGASNTSGLSPDPDPGSNPGPFTVSGGGTFTGGVVANDAGVTDAINYTNDLGQTLGGHSAQGTSITVTAGGSILASAGFLELGDTVDGNGTGAYRLFTVTSVNFPNGTFTITGDGSGTDQVVLDIGINANLHGQIVLAGGLTPDHVLINMFGGNSTTYTGGPTLDVNTNGLITMGIFLDPNGGMSAVNTTINGRFFGGDVQNQQIVSGADINAPPKIVSVPVPVPEPGTIVLLLAGMLGMMGLRRFGRPVA